MVLGSLTMGLKAINILQPPLHPYNGFLVKGLLEGLQKMRVPRYCNDYLRSSNYCTYYSSRGLCEGVQVPLKAESEGLMQKLRGLELTD